MTRLRNTLLVFSGEINNGIKKESVAKDTPRLWVNEGMKMQTFSHSLVNTLLISNKKTSLADRASSNVCTVSTEASWDQGRR